MPCEIDIDNILNSPNQAKNYRRPNDCELMLLNDLNCKKCTKFVKQYEKQNRAKEAIVNTPVKRNAPLTKTHPNRVQLALKEERAKSAELQKTIDKMRKEIQCGSVKVDDKLATDLEKIMSDNLDNASPFMKLFWEEQKKNFDGNKNARVYHPMIIRFCLSLASKSASCYDELRNSNVLILPSRRTLRNYKNAIRPHAGFNYEIINELLKTATALKGYQRYIVLSFDELKIHENLVYDKHSGELIGYVDLGDPELNYSTFQNTDDLATHVLVYYIRELATDLKFSLAYFATKGITSYQIMPTFWEAVAILESTCQLPVNAAVSDGASPNRKCYRMHSDMDDKIDAGITHRTINLYAPDRHIWFFADAPHLKTTRNCIFHSGMRVFIYSNYLRNKINIQPYSIFQCIVRENNRLGASEDEEQTSNFVSLKKVVI